MTIVGPLLSAEGPYSLPANTLGEGSPLLGSPVTPLCIGTGGAPRRRIEDGLHLARQAPPLDLDSAPPFLT